ncbi:Uncharacterised protein [Mycobacteroides abscessus]|nr:Uncharacterised protein [Mycobacteroides abscessus]
MSGALPDWMRTGSWASNSLEPSYSIVAPVHSSNGSYDACCCSASVSTIVE